MYAAIREIGIRRFAVEQAPQLLATWLIAELWYKWGSFTLELIGFLGTWVLLDYVVLRIRSLLTRSS